MTETSARNSPATEPFVAAVPDMGFVAFQAMFACLTVGLIAGTIVDRSKFSAWLVFAGVWAVLVYFPVAHWVFNLNPETGGWLYKLGVIDFAGGTAVHINAGAAALALAIVIGRRVGHYQPTWPTGCVGGCWRQWQPVSRRRQRASRYSDPVFANLSDRLAATIKGLRGKGRLSESDVDATVREIRTALLEADVALPVVREFTAVVKERALAAAASGALNPAQQIVKIVHEELIVILGGETRNLVFAKNPPTVILLAGLQGAGKTTLAGKLALQLKNEGHTPLLVAADLQRPNAVDQLRIIAEQAGVAVFAPEPGNGVGDPIRVTKDARVFAEQKLHDVVIVDTAGRLAIDAELMQQLRAVRDAARPDETLLVVDAMIGQDAVRTAVEFAEGVGFDAVVLTKLDGDARGGAALSIVSVTKRPIMFASVGEKLTDFEVFHPDRMASRILDMGDMLTLIEQAERVFDAEQTERMARKVSAGEDFTLDDFLEQMQSLKKMGSIGKIMGMLPGMGEMKAQLDQVDDREMDRVAAIIQSMTPAERQEPKILNGSRRARIARGSGSSVSEVNGLIERFSQAQKMMKQMGKGGVPGLPGGPGLPGMPGLGGGKKSKGKMAKASKPAKGKSRSGNPAKRADQEAGIFAPTAVPADLDISALPPEFKKLLN